MPNLYVPIGIPGSAKTTWTKSVLDRPWTEYVSTDAIRAEWPGGYEHNEERNAQVFAEFHRRIVALLSRGSAVADATNLQAKHRATLLQIAESWDADVHYLIFTNVAQAVLRNARREGVWRVPDEAMLGFVAQYERALKDVLYEPYDSITYIERTE